MTDSKNVVVVIPRYRAELSLSESISLNRAKRVLGKYPIVYMSPESLALKEPAAYFPDEDFSGRLAYSKLLLTPRFYEKFADYEYMLLYQLDAFVFYDKLAYFCSLGYDYIGAPMTRYSWRNIGNMVGNMVGNGGLSLRKISSCIRVTRSKE